MARLMKQIPKDELNQIKQFIGYPVIILEVRFNQQQLPPELPEARRGPQRRYQHRSFG